MLDTQLLITESLHLIPYKREFDDYIMRLHNDAARTTYDDNDPVKQKEQYINYIHNLIDNNSAVMWLIRHRNFKIPLGIVYLTDIIPGIMANFHPVIDREGYKVYIQLNGNAKFRFMREAAPVVISYGFRTFDLQRIGGSFFSINKFAISFVKKLGFRQEGIIRHGTKVNGKPEDLTILGVTKDEWKKS